MLWREEERSKIWAVQMDKLSFIGYMENRWTNRIPNAQVRVVRDEEDG